MTLAPPAPTTVLAPPGATRRSRTAHPLVLVALLYLACSAALFHRVLGSLSTATTGWASSDSYLFVWWLEWTPWALLHGQNPLFTTYQHFPFGVNGMWNTTMPILGVLFAPLTLTAGPVATYNVAMIVGPTASGLALVLALRPYVTRWVPRTVAGLLYGFCPFVIAHSSVGHLNLVWAVLPPVLLWAVHAVFVSTSGQPRRAGALLGLALAVQTGFYTQTVALAAVVLVVVAVVLALRWPRLAVERAPRVARAAAACCAVYALVCAYPIYQLLAGTGRPRSPIRDATETGADVANLVVPTTLSAFRLGTDGLAGRLATYPGEQGGYVGAVMVALLVAMVVLMPRPEVRVTAAVAVTLTVLSWGVHLTFLGQDTGLELPWKLLEHVPLVAEAEAVRLQIFIALCVAVLVALWLEHLAAHRSDLRRWLATAATLGAAVTWLPAGSQASVPATVPAFFAAAEQYLHGDDVVETFPRISGQWVGGARPLLWQAAGGMAFRTTGGYFIGADPAHELLLEAPVNAYQIGAATVAAGQRPALGVAAAARRDLAAAGVTAVVVVDDPGVDSAAVARWTGQVTGMAGDRVDGVWMFRPSVSAVSS